jgi:hypothetical protein
LDLGTTNHQSPQNDDGRTDAKQAVKTRLKMLSFLAENRIPILAYRFAWPGYGHFVKRGEGFRYLPAAMNMNR